MYNVSDNASFRNPVFFFRLLYVNGTVCISKYFKQSIKLLRITNIGISDIRVRKLATRMSEYDNDTFVCLFK